MMSKLGKVLAMRKLINYNLACFVAGSVRDTLLLLSIIIFATVLGGRYYSLLMNKEILTQRG